MTYRDLRGIPEFADKTILAIKAPPDTLLEYEPQEVVRLYNYYFIIHVLLLPYTSDVLLYSLSKTCVVPETVTVHVCVLFCGFGVGYGIIALQWTKPAREIPLPPSFSLLLSDMQGLHILARSLAHTHIHTHPPQKLYSSP